MVHVFMVYLVFYNVFSDVILKQQAQGVGSEPNKLMIRLTDGHNVTLLYDDRHTVLEHIYLITGKWQSQQPV